MLQEQVFDRLNEYTFAEIKSIVANWKTALEARDSFVKSKEGTAESFWKQHHEYDEAISQYRCLSGYLARIEHFSLGVNTGIYDVKVTERATTSYLTMLYKKLNPLLEAKNGGAENKYHTEFQQLVASLQAMEKQNVG